MDTEVFHENTLTKVYDALERSGLTHWKAVEAVREMQNEGILFRERTRF